MRGQRCLLLIAVLSLPWLALGAVLTSWVGELLWVILVKGLVERHRPPERTVRMDYRPGPCPTCGSSTVDEYYIFQCREPACGWREVCCARCWSPEARHCWLTRQPAPAAR